MECSVAYANRNISFRQDLTLAEPITAEQAILKSKLPLEYPDLDLTVLKIGIFGKVCKKEQLLKEGDRVEIYQPIIAQEKHQEEDDDDE